MNLFKKTFLSSSGMGLFMVAVIAINIIAARFYLRADLTQESVYSLSQGSRNIVAKVEQPLTFQLYFSRSSKELPIMIKTYATRVEEVLREYASQSGGTIGVEVLDPKPDSDEEVWARRYGISPIRLPSGADLYFGVALLYGDKDVSIPYLDPRREEFLEYDLSEAILQTQSLDKVKVGIYSSLPVMGGADRPSPMMPPQGGGQAWAFVEQLKRYVNVVHIKEEGDWQQEGLKVAVLLHPKSLTESMQYRIDQFVMAGGRLVVAVDPFSRIDLGAQQGMMGMTQQMPDASSDFGKFFDSWGIAYDKSKIAGDLKYTVRVNAGGQVVPYPFWMNLDDQVLSDQSPITSKLSSLLFAEPGSIAYTGEGLRFEELITTSENSGEAGSTLAGFMGPADFAKELKVDDRKRVLAGLLSGRFKSAFGEQPPADVDAGAHISEATDEGVVMIVADSDFLHDSNAVDRMQFGAQVIMRPRNDNLNLVFNAVEFLAGSTDLISIRSRGRIARPFTKVQDLQVEAQKRYQQQEQELSQKISELQKKLNELQKEQASGSRFALGSQQMREIERFREEEQRARERRREVRKGLREDIETLGKQLIAANMLFVPFGVSIGGLVVFVRRNRRRSQKREG